MSMQDPVSDMLTRIRNAQAVYKKQVKIPASKLKSAIAKVLKDEGYIADVYDEQDVHSQLVIKLKYFAGKPVINRIERISRPGLRIYKNKDELPSIDNGLGVAIVSTSAGVISGQKAKVLGLGGEVLCAVS